VRYLRVKNWEEFQHYKDRNPPWIKLHRTLLDDYEFSCLQDASKAHLMLIWLFASQKNGSIPEDPAFLKKKLGLEKEPNLNLFIDHGLLIPEQDASNTLADGKQDAPLEESYKASQKQQRREEAVQLIEFLNSKAGRNYDAKGKNLEFVLARLRDGATVEDCRAVIAKKCREWLGDPKMNTYLRPETLFNDTKFASYKGELAAPEREAA
jgi:uncharacterized phage protein (TIGR02220 family)